VYRIKMGTLSSSSCQLRLGEWLSCLRLSCYSYANCWRKRAQWSDRQHCTLLHRLLEEESIATCQTTQCQLYSELVEGLSWAGGPDENLVSKFGWCGVVRSNRVSQGLWHLVYHRIHFISYTFILQTLEFYFLSFYYITK